MPAESSVQKSIGGSFNRSNNPLHDAPGGRPIAVRAVAMDFESRPTASIDPR
jgi:hypothetical protein